MFSFFKKKPAPVAPAPEDFPADPVAGGDGVATPGTGLAMEASVAPMAPMQPTPPMPPETPVAPANLTAPIAPLQTPAAPAAFATPDLSRSLPELASLPPAAAGASPPPPEPNQPPEAELVQPAAQPAPTPTPTAHATPAPIPSDEPRPEAPVSGARSWLRNPFARAVPSPSPSPAPSPFAAPTPAAAPISTPSTPIPTPMPAAAPPPTPAPPATPPVPAPALPSPAPFQPPAAPTPPTARAEWLSPVHGSAPNVPESAGAPELPAAARKNWMDRLRGGLRKTSSSIATVFTGTRIDDSLYEELEEALLMADTGVKATQYLLADLKRRVKDSRSTDPAAVKGLLADALTDLLRPLEKSLVIGEFKPTVIMVAGVNGAGKTTSIGKLTRHLAQAGASVLLAAADTFRAAAREQLGVWADRNTVEIVSQEGGDPAAVSFDAVMAGRARGKDVVLVDTAGRLPTQLHLMEELRKIKRTIAKAGNAPGATGIGQPPHEILLVIDGNTGQNALAQVRAFDDALQLTGLVVTKLDGTAKGGVLAAIAQERPLPVYFIGVGEKLEDLETFSAREFALALLT